MRGTEADGFRQVFEVLPRRRCQALSNIDCCFLKRNIDLCRWMNQENSEDLDFVFFLSSFLLDCLNNGKENKVWILD